MKNLHPAVNFPDMTAFQAGYSAGWDGPNTINADFRFFESEQSRDQWERGARAAEEAREKTEARP